MSFYLWLSLAVFVLIVHDLIKGKITWGSFVLFVWPNATRRDDPKHFWMSMAWRTAVAVGLAALAFFQVPDPK